MGWMNMFTLLHTSDWHLGRQLYGHNRHAEFHDFLLWLENQLQQQRVDALLIAGDVFDTITPNHAAQQLYYRFLAKVATEKWCRHIVIIGGNHDSASFLNAPQTLLSALNVVVIGAKTADPEDEILLLQDADGVAQAIVCATPYLRDRDVRLSQADEGIADKHTALLNGIHAHYRNLYHLAQQRSERLGITVPIIAMGHLFTQGGQTIDADGVRELYVGNLAHVQAQSFAGFDYVALGHLHVPQQVANLPHIRYCGSPIAMGFGEAGQQKTVLHVAFTGRLAHITPINIPTFHPMIRISGDLEHIRQSLAQWLAQGSNAYVEIVYQGKEVVADLVEQVEQQVAGSDLLVLRIENRVFQHTVLQHEQPHLALAQLNPNEVFEACLQQHHIEDAQQQALRDCHQQVLHDVLTADEEDLA